LRFLSLIPWADTQVHEAYRHRSGSIITLDAFDERSDATVDEVNLVYVAATRGT